MIQYSAESNRLLEIEFESTTAYQYPFKEITLDGIFTEPSGVQRRVPAFWAGGNTWRLRYASPTLGTHRFVTDCSDQQNSSLHKVSGAVTITPYSGDNPLLRHGPLRVADDQRHFAHADGTPFFWLGDTWWMGLTKRLAWPEEFQRLTADRRSKGFNVVQIVAGLYPDMPAFDERGAGDDGFPWELDYANIRPQFFDAADRRIMHLIEQGIVPCILGGWGYHLLWLSTEKMKQHWRYLVARWGALPVVWAAAGEQTMPWYLSNNKEEEKELLKHQWTEVIRFLRQIDGFQRLITTHPQQSARESVDDPHLLDFEMQQTGHRSSTKRQAVQATEGWQTQPIMPVISGESRYEALGIWPPVTTRDVRQAFWAHLLSSGCAGHTYGANGVWQVNQPGLPFGKSPRGNNWGDIPWNEAIHLAGSSQLANAKRFLQSLPWHKLCGISNQASWKDKIACLAFPSMAHKLPVAAAAAPDGTLALYYLLYQKPVTLNMKIFSAPVYASWFDPAGGIEKTIAEAPFTNSGNLEFTPPGKNSDGESDWVLVLQAE
ncbi:MAG: apiosidase-like domain-containing protein [Methylotenera sp.]